jgi:hypothetical protein
VRWLHRGTRQAGWQTWSKFTQISLNGTHLRRNEKLSKKSKLATKIIRLWTVRRVRKRTRLMKNRGSANLCFSGINPLMISTVILCWIGCSNSKEIDRAMTIVTVRRVKKYVSKVNLMLLRRKLIKRRDLLKWIYRLHTGDRSSCILFLWTQHRLGLTERINKSQRRWLQRRRDRSCFQTSLLWQLQSSNSLSRKLSSRKSTVKRSKCQSRSLLKKLKLTL